MENLTIKEIDDKLFHGFVSEKEVKEIHDKMYELYKKAKDIIDYKKYKEKVLNYLNQGCFIWTNEGEGFEVWIGDEFGNDIIHIDKDLTDRLLRDGVIKLISGNHDDDLFKYELAQ